ncbi:MAG: glycosyltransferase family 39 protein [Bradyrhizobiaceae bacterium]|nr:MAG: glycosyltransferase family 39 protein [Bradyrhizobiaceae bacterium]
MTTDLARRTAWIVGALVLVRLIVAAFTPLAFDEAYYWTWSKHLQGGYYDHPPMVAFIIRLGTMIAGDTQLGVRLVSILLALPMSWAVYRTAQMLFAYDRIASASAIFLNATLVVSVGTIITTPDSPLMVASAFVLYALAKVLTTGRGVWWLGVGVAVGLALLSKYTALYFGAAILIWLLLAKDLRRWLATPWPYLGALLSLAIFSPVLFWNADHQWVSFIKQLGRAQIRTWSLNYFAELVPVQFGFATPSVFILGVLGLYALSRRNDVGRGARVLIATSVLTLFCYMAWHSFHERVEGNWLAPVYPAFAIAAAYAAYGTGWTGRLQKLVHGCRRSALAVGIILFALLILQLCTGIFTLFKRDGSVRAVGIGWPAMARDIEAAREVLGATCVLANDYGTTSMLMFYLPKGSCIAQYSGRIRWENLPEPDDALLRGRVLMVGMRNADTILQDKYARTERLQDLTRTRLGAVIETYELDLLERAKGATLDRSPPPEIVAR